MSTKTNRRVTNRISVSRTEFYHTVVITTNDGFVVQGHYPTPNGTSRDFRNATPRWFMTALRDLRDTQKFPHLNRAIEDLAILVKNTSITVSGGHRTPWADVELELFRITRVARDGWVDDSCETVRVPAEPSVHGTATVSRVGGGLTAEDLDDLFNMPVCDTCFIVMSKSGGCAC